LGESRSEEAPTQMHIKMDAREDHSDEGNIKTVETSVLKLKDGSA